MRVVASGVYFFFLSFCLCAIFKLLTRFVSKSDTPYCIVNSEPFKQATNMFAVRNMLMQLHGRGRIKISDPPLNAQMRYGFYRSAMLFIGKLK